MRAIVRCGDAHQRYQPGRRLLEVVVDHRDVELPLGGELDARGLEPPLALLPVLGAPADEPAHELVPRRRREEHEQRLRHRGPDLAGALQVDLEQRRAGPRRAPARPAARGVPYRCRPCTTAHSSIWPSATSRSNSASSTKW